MDTPPEPGAQQVPPPESRYADELARLAELDGPRPPGWLLTPSAVVSFVCGNARLGVSRKFVGDPALVERCVITLAGERALLLVGEPVHPRPRLRGQLDREHVRAETVEQAGDGDGQRGRVVAHPDQERGARGRQRRDLPVRAHTRRPRHCSSAPRSSHSCSHVRIPCAARRLTTESQ